MQRDRFSKTSRGAMLRGDGCHIGFLQRCDHDDLRSVRAAAYRFQQSQSVRAGIDIDNNEVEPLHLILQDPECVAARLRHEHIAAGAIGRFRHDGFRIAIGVNQKG